MRVKQGQGKAETKPQRIIHRYNSCLARRLISLRWPRQNQILANLALQVKAFLWSSQLGRQTFDQNLKQLPYKLDKKWANNWKYRNSRRVMRIKAVSISLESRECPLVPPHYNDHDTKYQHHTPEFRRQKTREEQLKNGMNNLSRTHTGTFYSGEYITARGEGLDLETGLTVPKMKIIDTKEFDHGFIDVVLPDGRTTTIDFHCMAGLFQEEIGKLNESCRKMGYLWERAKNTVKEVRKNMIKFGVVSMCGSHNVDLPALRSFGENGVHVIKEMNIRAKELCRVLMPKLMEEIQQCSPATVPARIGGCNGLCSVMFQSRKLENEAHFDPNDLSKCFVQWTCMEGRDHEGWYLVFNNLHHKDRDGPRYEGVAIRLRDGIIVSWDGREVSHCSTKPDGKNTVTWGTWFGATKRATGHR